MLNDPHVKIDSNLLNGERRCGDGYYLLSVSWMGTCVGSPVSLRNGAYVRVRMYWDSCKRVSSAVDVLFRSEGMDWE